ncbi:MAG: hypothetical protein ACR2H9_19515, partial [Longimicrobiaceae bacterium]
ARESGTCAAAPPHRYPGSIGCRRRAVRGPVLWRRTSFGSASGKGLRFAERVLTVVATCRQHERNVVEYLTQAIVAHRADQPIPRLIPSG